jgi:anti-sigma B factor antagonist
MSPLCQHIPMSKLTISTQRDGHTLTFTLSGELDLGSATELRDTVGRELATHDSNAIVLTLAQVTFLDSSGLGCLVSLHKDATEQGKTFRLQSLPDGARRIIELGGLAPLFALDDGA